VRSNGYAGQWVRPRPWVQFWPPTVERPASSSHGTGIDRDWAAVAAPYAASAYNAVTMSSPCSSRCSRRMVSKVLLTRQGLGSWANRVVIVACPPTGSDRGNLEAICE